MAIKTAAVRNCTLYVNEESFVSKKNMCRPVKRPNSLPKYDKFWYIINWYRSGVRIKSCIQRVPYRTTHSKKNEMPTWVGTNTVPFVRNTNCCQKSELNRTVPTNGQECGPNLVPLINHIISRIFSCSETIGLHCH